MTTIYLSSTYSDLKEYREVVYQALRQSGYDVIAMEDYVATDQRPVEKCLKDVEKADIYVGLLAFRYGYIPPAGHNNPDGLSITELEFRHAQASTKPCLLFIAKEDAGIALTLVDSYTGEGDKGELIGKFRRHALTAKSSRLFSSPYRLASLVQAALAAHLRDRDNGNEPALSAPPTWDVEKNGSPYPGLMHFTRNYAPVFFGREPEVTDILDRMRSSEGRFIVISGDLGVGKSSLVDAGILPRLEQFGLSDGKTCLCERILPSQGDDPFAALINLLHPYATRAGLTPKDLLMEWKNSPDSLLPQLRKIISQGTGRDTLVLFLDQMEELFTAHDAQLSKRFLTALYNAALEDNGLWVVATIRSDFLHYLHGHGEMLKVLNGRGRVALGQPEEFMIRDMIVKPAERAGLTFTPGLANRLAREAESNPGSLPLLAFALQRLFERRQGGELSESVYRELGGLTGAIWDHIDEVEKKLADNFADGLPALLGKIFLSLVAVNVDGQPTRRRALKTSFAGALGTIVDTLIDRMLLHAEGEGPSRMVFVAHEKLFDAWPSLARWIAENRDDLAILRQAEIAAREWEKHGYALKYLWHGDRLKRLRQKADRFGAEQIKNSVKTFAAPQQKLLQRLDDNSLSHQERLSVGTYLAEFGDPRPGVGLRADGLPNIEWIDIPPGKLQIGDVRRAFEVKPFRISKFIVTNKQFETFVDAADGYKNKLWWKGIKQSETPVPPRWTENNGPRETVSWYEAVAFCRWLSARLELKIRLPTEWEWQQAATSGDAKLVYPWPGGFDSRRCNSFESGLNRTTAVGVYPHGATAQGVLDMAGNVWEWCLNKLEQPGFPNAVYIDDTDARRVIHGGSWVNDPGSLRTSFRFGDNAGFRFRNIGFRLAQELE
ncbi:MAG: DUF4062 domain-containing protein [Deltaproteobacteria bacterium]|nr:DUF4062 domain-containing protein [Deltaproteobacteria bacterium]